MLVLFGNSKSKQSKSKSIQNSASVILSHTFKRLLLKVVIKLCAKCTKSVWLSFNKPFRNIAQRRKNSVLFASRIVQIACCHVRMHFALFALMGKLVFFECIKKEMVLWQKRKNRGKWK